MMKPLSVAHFGHLCRNAYGTAAGIPFAEEDHLMDPRARNFIERVFVYYHWQNT